MRILYVYKYFVAIPRVCEGSFVTCAGYLSDQLTIMTAPVILNAFYDAGNVAGHFLAWATSLTLTLGLVYVMFKYVFAKSK